MKKTYNIKIIDPLNTPDIQVLDDNMTPLKNCNASASFDLVPYKGDKRKDNWGSYKVLKIKLEVEE